VLHQHIPFYGNPGRKVDIDDTSDPLKYFQLFVTEDMLACIVAETNIQAAILSMRPKGVKGHSQMNKWKDTNIDEMNIFFALMLLQGTVQKQNLKCFGQLDHCWIRHIFSRL